MTRHDAHSQEPTSTHADKARTIDSQPFPHADPPTLRPGYFERLPDLIRNERVSRTTIFTRVKSGVLPPPVSLGDRALGWPAHELAALRRARVAGMDENTLRALVRRMVEARAAEALRIKAELLGAQQ
jgi:prophage regulatory protein